MKSATKKEHMYIITLEKFSLETGRINLRIIKIPLHKIGPLDPIAKIMSSEKQVMNSAFNEKRSNNSSKKEDSR